MSVSTYQIVQGPTLAALAVNVAAAAAGGYMPFGNLFFIPPSNESSGLGQNSVALPMILPGTNLEDVAMAFEIIEAPDVVSLTAAVNAAMATGLVPFGDLILVPQFQALGVPVLAQMMISPDLDTFLP